MKKTIIYIIFCYVSLTATCLHASVAKDNDEQKIALQIKAQQEYPSLLKLNLMLSGQRNFFDVWNTVGDKALVLKAALLDPLMEKEWQKHYGINLYNELNKLFLNNKDSMNIEDQKFLSEALAKLKQRIPLKDINAVRYGPITVLSQEVKSISPATIIIEGKQLNHLILYSKDKSFNALSLLAVQTTNAIIEQYKTRKISREQMKQLFLDTKHFFLDGKMTQSFYPENQKKENKQLLSKIFDAYINQSDAIAKQY
jgi:Holliday junction resolvase